MRMRCLAVSIGLGILLSQASSAQVRPDPNGFYDPELNAHFYHVASDSGDDGEFWACRYKRGAR